MKELQVNSDIRLKEIEFEDVKPIFEIIDKERVYLSQWLPFVDETRDISYTRTFVENYMEMPADEFTFTIFYQQKLVGLVGMKDTDFENKKTEIGYWLSESYQNLGIMTLSVQKLIELIFEELHLNRIQIKSAIGNFKSQQIARRIGFIFEGIERQGELHERGFVDLEVYSLLEKDYRQLYIN